MSNNLSFGPIPTWEYYYAAIDKQTGKTVAVGESSPGVIADAAEKTGLPKDCFELRQISKEEYDHELSQARNFGKNFS